MRRKILVHLGMLTSFFVGGVLLTIACTPLAEKAIWVALIPLGMVFIRLVYEDLFIKTQSYS